MKYVVQSLQITEVHKIEGTDFNFQKLKKLYKLPMVLTATTGALVGGFTGTFTRAATL